MTITRNEFKEYIRLYKDIWEWFKEHEDILTDSVLDIICEPLDFIGRGIGAVIQDVNYTEDIPLDLVLNGEYPISWDIDPEGYCCNIQYTDDLDLIYDKYINKQEE